MKRLSKQHHWLGYATIGAGLLGGLTNTVRAQDAAAEPPAAPVAEVPAVAPAAPAVVAPTTADAAAATGRFYVEIKDATLYDAVLMVQQSAGRTDYQVDEAAKGVFVPAVTFNNAPWDSIIRRLVNEANFRIVPQANGTKQIEPRPQLNYDGGYGSEGGYPGSSGYGSGGYAPGGYPGGSGGSGSYGSGSSGYGPGGYPGGSGGSSSYGSGSGNYGSGSGSYGNRGGSSSLPSNPFNGGGDRRGGRRPQVQQFENRQTLPGGLGGAATTGDNAGKEYRLVPVRRVYVGGIAKLFANSEIVGTEDFLIPDSALGGNNGGGGFGGGGFGGGFGNNGGGFGNNGGFGGGFGNNGGFGGGFGNNGGFGGGFGNNGGFGGGGFGGGFGGGLNNAVNGGFGF